MVGPNGRPMAALLGQQLTLLGKWPMVDRYIVLCYDIKGFYHLGSSSKAMPINLKYYHSRIKDAAHGLTSGDVL